MSHNPEFIQKTQAAHREKTGDYTDYLKASHICPHCGTKLVIRNSRKITETTRDYALQCRNPVCSASFVGRMELVSHLAPSMTPNPAIRLPLSPKREREQFAENMRAERALAAAAQLQMDLEEDNPRKSLEQA
jgi:ribosomal protein L37AE/L43A